MALTVIWASTLLLVIVVRLIWQCWWLSHVCELISRMRSMRGTLWRPVTVGRLKGRWGLVYVAATGHLTDNYKLLISVQPCMPEDPLALYVLWKLYVGYLLCLVQSSATNSSRIGLLSCALSKKRKGLSLAETNHWRGTICWAMQRHNQTQ